MANKEQTENLFAETKNAVTILVSRCLYQVKISLKRFLLIRQSILICPESPRLFQDDDYEERRAYRRVSRAEDIVACPLTLSLSLSQSGINFDSFRVFRARRCSRLITYPPTRTV